MCDIYNRSSSNWTDIYSSKLGEKKTYLSTKSREKVTSHLNLSLLRLTTPERNKSILSIKAFVLRITQKLINYQIKKIDINIKKNINLNLITAKKSKPTRVRRHTVSPIPLVSFHKIYKNVSCIKPNKIELKAFSSKKNSDTMARKRHKNKNLKKSSLKPEGQSFDVWCVTIPSVPVKKCSNYVLGFKTCPTLGVLSYPPP